MSQPHRVVILSDQEVLGGATIATSRLATALVQAGVEVVRIVGQPDTAAHVWKVRVLANEPRERQRLLLSVVAKLSPAAAGRWENRLLERVRQVRLDRLLQELNPDVINVHNFHNLRWSPELVGVCLAHAPTAWTLHDMWSFTGRCAYNWDCHKFLTGCDASCPTPNEYPTLAPERIAGAWNQRRRLFADQPRLVAVSPSRWLASEARTGFWKGHRVETIPNGLPLEVYVPVDRTVARHALGIAPEGLALLTAAADLRERRKGKDLLDQALRHLRTRPVTLLTLGSGDDSPPMEGVNLHPLGFIGDERMKVLAYSAADLLVHPAPVDNLPNVVMESLACGTPCVGFDIGGVPEMVRAGHTGWLADAVTPEALATAIDRASDAIRSGTTLRESCRAVAEQEYGAPLQARRYLELFASMRGGRSQ